jgi:hypothetical protein
MEGEQAPPPAAGDDEERQMVFLPNQMLAERMEVMLPNSASGTSKRTITRFVLFSLWKLPEAMISNPTMWDRQLLSVNDAIRTFRDSTIVAVRGLGERVVLYVDKFTGQVLTPVDGDVKTSFVISKPSASGKCEGFSHVAILARDKAAFDAKFAAVGQTVPRPAPAQGQ